MQPAHVDAPLQRNSLASAGITGCSGRRQRSLPIARKFAIASWPRGDFELTTEFTYGALQPWGEHVTFGVTDTSGDSIEVDIRISQTAGSIGFAGGAKAGVTWAGYSPDPVNPPIGSTYFVRWEHSASGDRPRVWDDGTAEPSDWQTQQAATPRWDDAATLRFGYSSDNAANRWAGGWLGVFFIDVS